MSFGAYKIHQNHVFYKTSLSFAVVNKIFVNLKPVVGGHVLVAPRRIVARYGDLKDEEVCDLWRVAKSVGGVVERHYQASSLTFAVQDGPEAGQTVAHVHIHVLPRKKGDFLNNDDVYPAIDKNEKELSSNLSTEKVTRVDAEERKPRSFEEMEIEATILSKYFDPFNHSS